MTIKIRIFVIAFIMPVFMLACTSGESSSPGGVLTLGDSTHGKVVQWDEVQYTIPISSGGIYLVNLITTSGNADLKVCDSPDCSGYKRVSENLLLLPDGVTVGDADSYDGLLYIFVSADFTISYYRIGVF